MWSQPSEVLCTSALMEVMHRQGNKKLRKIFLENFSFVLKIVFSEPLRLRLPILPICLNFVTERDNRIQKCTFAEHRHIANKAVLVSTIGHLCHTNTTHFANTTQIRHTLHSHAQIHYWQPVTNPLQYETKSKSTTIIRHSGAQIHPLADNPQLYHLQSTKGGVWQKIPTGL